MMVERAPRLALWLGLLCLAAVADAASPIHKCVVDGKVTFQHGPCASEKPSRPPTVEELNAARRKRLAESAAQAASAAPAAATPGPSPSARQAEPAPAAASRDPAFSCDGRKYCSQMRSCAEARFFLANCPGVKMDGNRDGTPCEQQWCTHPFAK